MYHTTHSHEDSRYNVTLLLQCTTQHTSMRTVGIMSHSFYSVPHNTQPWDSRYNVTLLLQCTTQHTAMRTVGIMSHSFYSVPHKYNNDSISLATQTINPQLPENIHSNKCCLLVSAKNVWFTGISKNNCWGPKPYSHQGMLVNRYKLQVFQHIQYRNLFMLDGQKQ